MTANDALWNGQLESYKGSEKPAPDHLRFMNPIKDSNYINSKGQMGESARWKWWYHPQDCLWSMHTFSMMSITNNLADISKHQRVIMGRRGGLRASAHLRQVCLDGNMASDTVNERKPPQ